MAIYYTASTLIQTANSWSQWYWLATILQSPLHHAFWGPPLVVDLLNGIDWQLDTVLCVLTLNIYYEKLFIFLWFWLLFVAIISTSNSIYWVVNLCVGTKEEGTLIEFCRESQNKELCEQLLGAYLEQETEHQTHAEKRKPSFVRFGKRSLQAEKRKPSFVRFGRK
uniref:Innexin n=1 Tax=Heterorhabditis bacteriophora TaxID=37862 RepID=A0A1I7XJY1_HETBA